MTTTDKPRRRAPGGGRKPIGATRMAEEAAVRVRLDAATRAFWAGSGQRGELSASVRGLLTDVADGEAVVVAVDMAVLLAVTPWLAERLAEGAAFSVALVSS